MDQVAQWLLELSCIQKAMLFIDPCDVNKGLEDVILMMTMKILNQNWWDIILLLFFGIMIFISSIISVEMEWHL